MLMPKLFGGIGMIRKARELTKNARALSALDRLEKLYAILSVYGLERFVSFDLGMLGKFRYYTGVIFQAYTYGSGTPVATGGRYDGLIAQYGKEAPATGVAIYLDELLTALSRQNLHTETAYARKLLLYESRQEEDAIRAVNVLRGQGEDVILMRLSPEKTREDYLAYAKRGGIAQILRLDESGEKAEITETFTGASGTADLKDVRRPAE